MDKKKLAAAMAAVTAFIKTGETDAVCQNSVSASTTPHGQIPPAIHFSQMNIWGVTGRQALMQAAAMIQLRMFK